MYIPTIEYGGYALSACSLQAFPFSDTNRHAEATRRNGFGPTELIGRDFSPAHKESSSLSANLASTAGHMRSGTFIDVEDIRRNVLERDRLRRLEHAGELAASIESTREGEKKRIARELHDDLGQQLSGLKMDLAALEAELEVIGTPQSFISRISEMQCAIDGVISSVRRVAAGLRPAVLDDLGLLPALEWLTDDFAQRSGLHVTLHNSTSDMKFNDEASTALFRIVQEALTNVVRHAKDVTEVDVELAFHGDACVQTISDNGVASAITSCSSMHPSGHVGIRERVRQLGGTVNIGRTLEHGFCVAVSIPVFAVRRK